MNPARLTDAELLEAIARAAARAEASNTFTGLALEAGARIRARGRDALRDRASCLEDAAFHFQTCSRCRTLGDAACESGSRFAAYLRGDIDLEGAPTHGPLTGRARKVVIHADGRLTCELEIDNGTAGARFLEQIKAAR
jgi:hypothetical protein